MINKQRKHYIFMAAIMMVIALIGTLKFDMHYGYYWLVPCFFGFIAGGYIYVAIIINR